jgi:hypothetical protein
VEAAETAASQSMRNSDKSLNFRGCVPAQRAYVCFALESGHLRRFFVIALAAVSASAADRIEGRVEGGGRAIAKANVTLWVAGLAGPKKLTETQTRDDGGFDIGPTGDQESPGVLYLIAKGPDPAITLMATLGTAQPQFVTINELTTVASAWTAAQFLDGNALNGNALGLRIAAGNVPNLVNLETGGLGTAIQDPLNSSQTTTLAKFNTLGNLLSACITAMLGACDKLFEVATPPGADAQATRFPRRRTSRDIHGTRHRRSLGYSRCSILSRPGRGGAKCPTFPTSASLPAHGPCR